MTQIHEPLNDLISSNSTYNSNISPALNNYLAQINQLNIPQYLQYSDSNSNYQLGFSLTPQSQSQTPTQQILTPNNQTDSANNQSTQTAEIPLSTNIDNIPHQGEKPVIKISQANQQQVTNQLKQQMNQQQQQVNNNQITPQQINQQQMTPQISQQVPTQINPQMTQINQQQIPTQINPQVN